MTEGKVSLSGMAPELNKNVLQLAVIDGMIQESNKTGFAQVTTHALTIIQQRYKGVLTALQEAQQKIKFTTAARDQYKELSTQYGEELGELRAEVKRLREASGNRP